MIFFILFWSSISDNLHCAAGSETAMRLDTLPSMVLVKVGARDVELELGEVSGSKGVTGVVTVCVGEGPDSSA